jgi:hypothetical protein
VDDTAGKQLSNTTAGQASANSTDPGPVTNGHQVRDVTPQANNCPILPGRASANSTDPGPVAKRSRCDGRVIDNRLSQANLSQCFPVMRFLDIDSGLQKYDQSFTSSKEIHEGKLKDTHNGRNTKNVQSRFNSRNTELDAEI